MKQMLLALALLMFAPEPSPAAPKSFAPFSQNEMLEIIATGNGNNDNLYRLAGVAFTVANAQTLYSDHPEKLAQCLGESPTPLADSPFTGLMPGSVKEAMENAALTKAKQLDAYSPKGSVYAIGADMVADLVSSSLDGPFGTMTKIVYPPLKDGLIREVSREARTPAVDREFAIAWATHAMQEVNSNSDLGKVLAPYVKKYLGIDPKQPQDQYPAVVAAETLKLEIQNGKAIDDILTEVAGTADVVKMVKDALADAAAQKSAAD